MVGYVTANTQDLDVEGIWRFQPYLECETQKLYGEIKLLMIYSHL